jgi:rfaE bifunctional protein kinase chain/domain
VPKVPKVPRVPRVPDVSPLVSLIHRLRGRRVLVIGDLIADEFVYGRVARVSREAPVLILEYDSTEIVPGGAGNAASNVAALGGTARLVTITGTDEAGRRVVGALPRRVERQGVVSLAGHTTPIKTRILAGGIHSAKQQVVRIDRLTRGEGRQGSADRITKAASTGLSRIDAVLISDYGAGTVSPAMVRTLVSKLRALDRDIPIVVDSRYQLLAYRGLTACTPNESEVEHLLGIRIDDRPKVLERAGRELLDRTRMRAVLITRGSRGMALFEPNRPTIHIPIYGSDQIADVTGAGDTVIASLTLALASGASFEEAARLANYAGGLVVMKRGTATVSGPELERAITAEADARR